jgi:protein HOOK3
MNQVDILRVAGLTWTDEIDADYFDGDLPELDKKQKGSQDGWIPRWQNLKYIDRLVVTYIRDECEQLPYLSKSLNPDLKAVATDGSPDNVIKLVKAVLLAAMYSEKSDQRSQIVEKVGLKGASAIADAIQEMEELDQRLGDMGPDTETGSEIDHSTDSDVPTRGTSYERDPELEREEKLIQALQEKRKLEEKLAYLEDDLKESEDKRRALEDELQDSKFGPDRRRRTTMDEENLQQLNLQAGRDRDYIAKLETDLSEANSTLENQQRQLERLKVDAESKQELRDELQFIKSERDELRQKSKANENLKKKIQALQEQERVNINMRRDLQGAQEQLAEVDHLRDRCSALEKANEENAKTIANGEQEIFDQKTAKEQLRYELKVLSQRFEQTRDMLTTAQESIRELEDRGPDMQDDIDGPGDLDLDAELNAEPGSLEEAEKKAAKRKSMAPVQSADNIVLQQNISIANASIARLEQRCLDLLQENLGFKSTLEGNDTTDHPFQHQSKRLETLEKEVEDIQAKYAAATSESADLRRLLELSESQGKRAISVSSVNHTNVSQAYGERQTSSDAAIAQSRDRLKYMEELQIQLREHRSLLRHALLSTDSLLKEADELRKSNEYKIVRQQLEVVREASAEHSDKVIEDSALSLTDRIEAARSLVADGEKVCQHFSPIFMKLPIRYYAYCMATMDLSDAL